MAMENQNERRVFNLVNWTPDIGPPVARPAPDTGRLPVNENLTVLPILEGQCFAVDHSRKRAHGPAISPDKDRHRLGAHLVIHDTVADYFQWKCGDLAAHFHRQNYLPGGQTWIQFLFIHRKNELLNR